MKLVYLIWLPSLWVLVLVLAACDKDEGSTPQPPVAVATASPDSGLIPLWVQFSTAGSTDPDGEIVRYSWDFDGDLIFDWTSTTTGDLAYKFTRTGTFHSTLNVQDDAGLSHRAHLRITVSSLYPNLIHVPVLLPETINVMQVFALTDYPASGIPPETFAQVELSEIVGTLGAHGWTDQDGDIFFQQTLGQTELPVGQTYMIVTGLEAADQRVQYVRYSWRQKRFQFLSGQSRTFTEIVTVENQTVGVDTIELADAIRLLDGGSAGIPWRENQTLSFQTDFPRRFHWEAPDSAGRYRYVMLIFDETDGTLIDAYPSEKDHAPINQTYYDYPFENSPNLLTPGHTYRWMIIGTRDEDITTYVEWYLYTYSQLAVTSEMYRGRFYLTE
ncbi:MAG: PKD domain-containing protein [Gemmatimonadetes bacterium]|nr:MAG: PKD domain-containing protein [Gemmatimonadota bacterium]